MRFEARVLALPRAELGEGPTWDAAAARLLWVDIQGRRVYAASEEHLSLAIETELRVTAIVPTADPAVALCATESGLAYLELTEGSALAPVADFGLEPRVRLNDGACDPAGRLWVGSMDEDLALGRARLYRYDGEALRVMRDGLSLSNGIDWTPGGEAMYHVDSLAGEVTRYRFDVDRGALRAGKKFATFAESEGLPDGLAVDDDGGIWVALHGGSRVVGFDPAGERRAEVALPTPLVTSCCFGGADGRTMYISTARGEDDDDLAGSMFAARLPVSGPPARVFTAPAGAGSRS
jgi:sugar lactone lactonase YvrE